MAVTQAGLRDVVRRALGVIDRETPLSIGEPLVEKVARELRAALTDAGYSIHRAGECVHPRSRKDDLGRPMTPDEMILVGLATAGDFLDLDG